MKSTAQTNLLSRNSFTLLELLIVMALVSVLIALSVSGVGSFLDYTAREAAANEFLNELLETKILAETNTLQSSIQRPPLRYTFNFTSNTFSAQTCQTDTNYSNATNCVNNISSISPSKTFTNQKLNISSNTCSGVNFYGTKNRFEIIPINGNTIESACYICLKSGSDFVRVIFINPPRKRIDFITSYTSCP